MTQAEYDAVVIQGKEYSCDLDVVAAVEERWEQTKPPVSRDTARLIAPEIPNDVLVYLSDEEVDLLVQFYRSCMMERLADLLATMMEPD